MVLEWMQRVVVFEKWTGEFEQENGTRGLLQAGESTTTRGIAHAAPDRQTSGCKNFSSLVFSRLFIYARQLWFPSANISP